MEYHILIVLFLVLFIKLVSSWEFFKTKKANDILFA